MEAIEGADAEDAKEDGSLGLDSPGSLYRGLEDREDSVGDGRWVGLLD